MSPVDALFITAKLKRLDEVIDILEKIKLSTTEEVFLHDKIIQGSVERYLTLGITIITDIGGHLLFEVAHRSPDTYEKIIEELGLGNIVPQDIVSRNKGMGQFRNLVIHEYGSVEPH